MGIFDLYSKRRKKEREEQPDVYQYDKIPEKFRVQVIHIIKDVYRHDEQSHPLMVNGRQLLNEIHDILCREYGLLQLLDNHKEKYLQLLDFFLQTEDSEQAIDVIELTFRIIDQHIRNESYNYKPKIDADSAIEELNARFKENCIGYQYESGEIVRVDSSFIHSEVVKPVLKLLSNKEYQGANEEFLNAHEHYRHKRNKECLNECLKSFESVLKTICKKRRWEYDEKYAASKLINVVSDKGLFPPFLQSQMGSLKSLLESGIPTIRNKLSGHGQGTSKKIVEEHWASYMLHITASTILFLVELEKNYV